MHRSSYIKIFLLGAISFALASCTKKKAGDDNLVGEGNVIVANCDGDGFVEPVNEFSTWKVSNQARVSFSACLIDRPSKKPLQGQHFEIEDEDGKRHQTDDNKPSDDTGCIKWHEPLDFNFYAKKSGTLELVRKIVSTNLKMSAQVSFYVNPWAMDNDNRRDNVKSVMCSKKVARPPDLISSADRKGQKSLLSGDGSDAELWLDKLDFTVIHRQRYGTNKKEVPKKKDDEKKEPEKKEEIGQVLEFKIELHPYIKLFDHNGHPSYKELEDGKFKVFAHLVGTDTGPGQNEKMILTTGEMGTIADVENHVLRATVRTSLEQNASFGNVALVLRLVPVGYGGQTPFPSGDAIYELGDIREFNGSKTGTLTADCIHHNKEKCSMDSFLKNTDNYERFRLAHLAQPNQTLFFSTVRLRFVTIAAYPPETATRRTVTYSASTCVNDSGGLRMARMPFIVEYVDDDGNPTDVGDPYQKQTIIADNEGCLRWMAHVTHDYYDVEKFVPKNVKIQEISSNKVKIAPDPYHYEPVIPFVDELKPSPEKEEIVKDAPGTTISFLLNPWDDKFTFGFDSHEVSPDFLATVNNRPKPESLFFTGGYGYHTIRFLYDIDNFMNLEVKKTILLEVDPRVLRYSGIVNARRTTENLRDGIYLLKVAIQKSFLDPAEPHVSIYQDPEDEQRAKIFPNRKDAPATFEEVPKRDYVTTKTTLVRVVDGRLIRPIELTMKDLRLMRVRSNFLIELQTIDERYLQTYDTLRQLYGDERAKQIQEEKKQLKSGNIDLNQLFGEVKAKEVQEEIVKTQKSRDEFKCPDEKVCNKDYLEKGKNDYSIEIIKEKLKERRAETTAKYKHAWETIDGLLRSNANDLAESDLPANMVGPLAKVFAFNDFTKQKLPDCDADDSRCERFVEKPNPNDPNDKKPYLKARTFVGPVIFLSNAYSDAVRATDNLDDVCREDNRFFEAKARARMLGMSEKDWRAKYETPGRAVADDEADRDSSNDEEDGPSEPQLFALEPEQGQTDPSVLATMPKGAQMISAVRRQNKDYLYTPYYNALSHLCYASVDDLIEKEKIQKANYQKAQPQLARLENFVKGFNMDFAVLTEENKKEYPSEDNRLNLNEATKNLDANKLKLSSPEEIHSFLMNFDRKTASDTEVETMCRFLLDHALSRVGELIPNPSKNIISQGVRAISSNYATSMPSLFERDLYLRCVNRSRTEFDEDSSIAIDRKLRVFETNSETYKFKGGLQLNLNVGINFGVTRSGSRSSSLEAIDFLDGIIGATVGYAFLGPVGAIGGALILKPLSFKPSDSMSWSEGTSVSTQTYLVAQVAKFEVELKQYEKCRIYRLSPNLFRADVAGLVVPGIDKITGGDPSMKNKEGIPLENIVTRGVMVCDGTMTTEPRRVPENYYYFTQHFTEGDMLDQADLLNSPWLLQLRGDRDFGTFIHKINALEDVSWWNYYKGAVGLSAPREVEWPLRKLEDTYKTTAPTFPGMYTDLPESQRITNFPINNKIIKLGTKDKDINAEVCNRPEACGQLFDHYRSKQQFQEQGSPGIKPREY